MIAVITDSCASIPPMLAKNLNIQIVPYYVHRGNETLRDGVDITADEFFELLPTVDTLPTTANPGPGDYLEVFERVAEWASGIVTVHMTSKGSGAYQAACVAREMAATRLPAVEIEVVDTLQVAMIHGYAAIEAARSAQREESLDQVVAAARYVYDTGIMLQAADTLKYLYMGGRIGRAQHLLATLLNVKPIVSMEDGIVVPVGQGRNMHQVYDKIVKILAERYGASTPIHLAVTYGGDIDRAHALAGVVKESCDVAELLICELSPALGVHTGPGLVGANVFPVPSEEGVR